MIFDAFANKVNDDGTPINAPLAGAFPDLSNETLNPSMVSGGASKNFQTGKAGWQITDDGSAEFNNVTARGTVIAGSSTGSKIVLDSTTGELELYYNNASYGSISVDSTTNMIYVARTSHFFFDQSNNYIGKLFHDSPSSYGLELFAGSKIQFTSGRKITDTGGTLDVDGTFLVHNGDCALDTGYKFQIGTTGGISFSSGNVGGLFSMNVVGGIVTFWQKY